MRNIVKYIQEKLHISNFKKDDIDDTIIDDDMIPDEFADADYPDNKKSRKNKEGKEYLWYKFWKYLCLNGPTSKKDLLKNFNLKETSYGTMFMQLSKLNIIIPKKRLLYPVQVSQWKL